jgi:AbrB family looped-hinge helix DNA binding protein
MMQNRIKIDSKGRVLIPASVRKKMGIQPDTELVLMPRKDGKGVSIMPISDKNAARCTVQISNSMRGLSNVMEVMEMLNVGVLMSQSRNLMGDGTSEWTFILDTTKSGGGSSELEERLSALACVKSVSMPSKAD